MSESERKRESVCEYVFDSECYVCELVSACVCERERVCMCVCVWDRERESEY